MDRERERDGNPTLYTTILEQLERNDNSTRNPYWLKQKMKGIILAMTDSLNTSFLSDDFEEMRASTNSSRSGILFAF